MDKRTVLAMVIIAVIIILIPYYQKLINGDDPIKKPIDKSISKVDSAKNEIIKSEEVSIEPEQPVEEIDKSIELNVPTERWKCLR